MKAGVIGATGLLGHHTALALVNAGHEPVLIHREGSVAAHIDGLTGERRIADINDEAGVCRALEGLDAVIHSAGYYPDRPRSWREHVRRARAQTEGFLSACRRSGISRVVYVGASVALPRALSGQPAHAAMRYEHQPNDRNAYLQCKWLMDDLCLRAAADGLPVMIAVPAMTFGEYDYGPSTGQFITRIANGEVRTFVDGERNVIYAGDAGRGIAHACEQGRTGERYLLTGANVRMRELVGRIAHKAGVAMPRRAPLGAARALAHVQALRYRVMGGKLPVINDTAIAVMAYGQHLNGEKAERELGFRASLRLEETLDRTFAWFRSVGYIT